MSAAKCHCTDAYRGHLPSAAARPRDAWRRAVAQLASPFVRLHELRNMRSRLLQDALEHLDGCKSHRHDA